MDKRYVEQLWGLFRKKYKNIYRLSEIQARYSHREKAALEFPALSFRKGEVEVFQSHSTRSAWLYAPWKDGKNWYVGVEYKGIGEDGKKIRRFAKTAWGGVYKKEALAEHRYAKSAFDSGIFCQRPLGIYDYGRFYGKDLAVVVRTFVSPIRLSDFMFEKRFFNRYLGIRGETEKEYCRSLSSTLGRNVRRLLDMGLYHGSMEINNITSEGELADFEPTYGGTWEGLRRTRKPSFRYLALRRVLDTGKNTFPKLSDEFNSSFADAFFGKRTRLRTSNAAKEIAETYCGTSIREQKRRKDDPRLKKVTKLLERMRADVKTKKQEKMLDFVLDSISGGKD
jgi:hypothetical protein